MLLAYQSFEGRFSDSPRALYEALVARGDPHEHVWLSDPEHEAGFPDGVRHVPFRSSEGIDLLQSADLVVANTHTDLVWRKRPDATYLQTWHGTPLKRIHRDVLWAPEGRLDRLDRDVAQWDVLLSPNRASTGPLRQAFRYDGEVLETGYPRNDALSAPDRDEVRARVRRELGVPDGVRAVLYAPTWRDDEVFEAGGGTFSLALDVESFLRELGDDHVLLLRLHYMLTGRLGPMPEQVREVSYHPDIRELYLAADVLVTDYSSTMFDFAITARPIVLYAYDLDRYRDEVRGFYFDVEETAPGPVVRTQAQLHAVLRDLDAVSEREAGRYARFRERFCHLEDGRATERVLARVLPAGGPA